ncbi:hypothetical protein ACFV98_38130 [Streptomyces violascens]|uniref:hypothetical protein n=1 Tax=Streptomyces violascens TaxID=67381 RepID=UPI0036569959
MITEQPAHKQGAQRELSHDGYQTMLDRIIASTKGTREKVVLDHYELARLKVLDLPAKDHRSHPDQSKTTPFFGGKDDQVKIKLVGKTYEIDDGMAPKLTDMLSLLESIAERSAVNQDQEIRSRDVDPLVTFSEISSKYRSAKPIIEVPAPFLVDRQGLTPCMREALYEKHLSITPESFRSTEVSNQRTGCEKALAAVSVAIAFASGLDAGIFKVVDNTFKERRSLLAKLIKAGVKVIKWHLIPGSFVVDMALLVTNEAHPPKKIKEISPYQMETEDSIRAKNREAFQDFLTTQGLGLINKLA